MFPAKPVSSWFDQELRPKILGLVPGYWQVLVSNICNYWFLVWLLGLKTRTIPGSWFGSWLTWFRFTSNYSNYQCYQCKHFVGACKFIIRIQFLALNNLETWKYPQVCTNFVLPENNKLKIITNCTHLLIVFLLIHQSISFTAHDRT